MECEPRIAVLGDPTGCLIERDLILSMHAGRVRVGCIDYGDDFDGARRAFAIPERVECDRQGWFVEARDDDNNAEVGRRRGVDLRIHRTEALVVKVGLHRKIGSETGAEWQRQQTAEQRDTPQ